MPYPHQPAKLKHSLLFQNHFSLDDANLLNDYGFTTSSALLEALHAPKPTNLMPFAAVYSYPDAPPKPLSGGLVIIGFAETSLSMIRKLCDDDDDDLPDCLHSCTLAVKRTDVAPLREQDVQNSNRFATFIRRLKVEGLVAIVGKDSSGRFGILKPNQDVTTEGHFEGQDFAALCYVGDLKRVQEYLASGVSQALVISSEKETTAQSSTAGDGLWVPPGSDTGAVQSSTAGDGLWVPPGSDTGAVQSSTAGDGLWVPPGSDNGTAQPSDAAGGLWMPPGSDTAQSSDGADGLWHNAADGLWVPPGSDSGTDQPSDSANGLWVPPGSDNGTAQPSDAANGLWVPPVASDNQEYNHQPQGFSQSTTRRNLKRPHEATAGSGYHDNAQAAAAAKFYDELNRSLDTRADSYIYHGRNFNGWVKAVQIQELDPKTWKKGKRSKLRVLDLACGKGGDLGKWGLHKRGIENYVGIDVAFQSLKDAAKRARPMRSKFPRCTFTCADLGSDVPGRLKSSRHTHMQELSSWSLQNESGSISTEPEFKMVRGGGIEVTDKFDVVSIQFAIHYMLNEKVRAKRFFRTVSQLLEVGGVLIATTIDARVVVKHLMNLGVDVHFDDQDSSPQEDVVVQVGGGACELRFTAETVRRIFHPSGKEEDLFGLEYTFTLKDGSDHAAGVGDAVNLSEWLTPIPVLENLAKEAGLKLNYAHNFHEFFDIRKDPSAHAAAHSAIRNMSVLNRHGSISTDEWEISRLYMAFEFEKVREPNIEEQDENLKKMEKLLPMAMMKAKKKVGDETWRSLSSEEKTKLANDELLKMAA